MAQSDNSNKNSKKLIVKKTLKIISLNVNSIISNDRRSNLLEHIKKHNPDILLLSETKLNKIHKFELKDFNIIRTDRPNATQGGGTAILIKNHIKFTRVLNNSQNNQILENTIIRLNINNKNFYIIAVYATYGKNEEFKTELNKLFYSLNLDKLENYYIIAGDLNAKHTDWNNENCNTKGKILKAWLNKNEFFYKTRIYHSDVPSHPRGNSYIDLCLADSRIQLLDILHENNLKTLNYDSDHKALLIHFNIKDYNNLIIETKDAEHKLNYKKTNWDDLKKNLPKTVI